VLEPVRSSWQYFVSLLLIHPVVNEEELVEELRSLL